MDQETRDLRRRVVDDPSLLPLLARDYLRAGRKICPCICGCLEAIDSSDIFCEDCHEDHWPHQDECNCRFCNLPTYYERGLGPFLELHANRTLNKINSVADNVDYEHFNMIYAMIVSDAVQTFHQQTGLDLHFLGRSGRHVCVEDTLENRANYSSLKERALRLEETVIENTNQTDF